MRDPVPGLCGGSTTTATVFVFVCFFGGGEPRNQEKSDGWDGLWTVGCGIFSQTVFRGDFFRD